ncbi:MAG: type II toxin-antitoxin system VapC family toxin [Acidimicrobiia bacterium]
MVDTTVWVDFFRGSPTWQVDHLVRLIEDDNAVYLTDVVLTEILGGVGTDNEARRVERRLSAFDVLRLEDLDDFRRAASLYRQARAGGYTIRRTLDCLIASVCVRDEVRLLHADADFDHLAACTDLDVVDRPSP